VPVPGVNAESLHLGQRCIAAFVHLGQRCIAAFRPDPNSVIQR